MKVFQTDLQQVKNTLRGGVLLVLSGLYLSEISGVFFLFATQKFHFSSRKITGTTYAVSLFIICSLRYLSLYYYQKWIKEKGVYRINFSINIISIFFFLATFLFAALWNGKVIFPPLFVKEYIHFFKKFGIFWGGISSFLQTVYYILEGFLIVYIIDSFQTAGETLILSRFPWGVFALVLFWGSIHFLKGTSTGIYGLILASLLGLFYLADKRNGLTVLISWLISLTV